MEKVTLPNGRTGYRHNGRLLTPSVAKLLATTEKKAAKQAARDTDHCTACASTNLFSSFYSSRSADSRRLVDALADERGTYRTVCQDCSTFQ